MTRFSVATLKEDWRRKRSARLSPLTPGIIGKIAACILILKQKNGLVPCVQLEKVFLGNLADAPEALRNVLHLDMNVTGISVRESTEMILGVQRVELAGRLNPEYDKLHIKCTPEEAETLLRHYEAEFPDVVKWIRTQAENMA